MDFACHGFDYVLAIEVHQACNGWVFGELSLQELKCLDVLSAFLQGLDRQEHNEQSLLRRSRKGLITVLQESRDNVVGLSVILFGLLNIADVKLIALPRLKLVDAIRAH